MKQRYTELDAIRGIAALMVVFFHYTIRYGEIYGYSVAPAFTFEIGRYGVQLFFIVSGFVIFLTLDKTTHAVDFIVSRFSRLYPAYWVAVILTFTIVSLFSLPGADVGIRSAVINLTMIQQFIKVPHVDGVYWTLLVELSFYTIMYVLFVTKLIRKIEIISILWLFVIMAAEYLETYQFVQIPGYIKFILMLKYGNLFIAGIMFYKLMCNSRLLNYMIILLALAVEYFIAPDLIYLIAIYFGVFFFFVKGYLKFLSAKPLVFLGAISYSLYLIHQNIGYVVIRHLDAYGISGEFSIIVVPLMVSILLASLIQRYIEQPSLVKIRKIWKESNIRERLTM